MVNVGGVEIDIRGDNSQFKREMRETQRIARQSGQRVADTFDRTSKSVTVLNNSLVRSRTSMLALGAAAGVALTSATRLIANFEQSMSTVRAVTGATTDQFEELTAKARELGATTRFTATQAAEGMTFLARAGFDVDEVLGSIEGTLKLAQAGNLDLARAADIASNVLQGMKLEVSETARVVDVLALAANSSNTDVSQLGDALKFVAPVASGLSVELEETTAAIGALSDAGLQSTLAGTGLRRVMIGLEKQSREGVDILARYGLTMEDVSVSANGFTPVLRKLADAGITTSEAMTLFGLRGGPAFEVLVSSVPKIESATQALNNAGGTANRVAEVMDDNLNGAILRAISALQELILAIGDLGVTPALEASLKGLADLLRLTAENADVLGVAVVALTARALLPLALDAAPKAARAIALTNVRLLTLTRNGNLAAAATTKLGGAMTAIGGPATLAIAAAAAAFLALSKNAEQGRKAIEAVDAAIVGARNALEATDKFDDTFYTLGNSALDTIPIFNQVRDAIREVSAALNETTVAGFVGEATQVFQSLEESRAALAAVSSQRDQELLRQTPAARRSETRESRLERAEQNGTRTQFDNEVVEARQAVAALELRLQSLGENVFSDLDLVSAFENGGLAELQRTLTDRLTGINNDAVIEAEKERIKDLQEALSNATTDSARKRFQDQIAEAREVIRLLENGVAENTAREIARENTRDGPKSTSVSADEIAQLQRVLELEFQLDLARTTGNQKQIQALEEELDIISRTQELVRAGKTFEEARALAEQRVIDLRKAENALLEETVDLTEQAADLARGDPRSEKEKAFVSKEQAEEEINYARERLKDGAADALLQAAQGGRWQDALGRAFYDVITDNMRDAFDDLFNQLGSIFGQVFSGSSGNAIGNIFGGIGDFLIGTPSSSSALSSGLSAATSFKADDFLSFGSTGDVSSSKGYNINQSVVVQGSLDSATLPQVQEMMAEQARQLPGMIDARVLDGRKRGKY